MLAEVGRRVAAPGVDDSDFQAGLGEPLGGPTARGARSDDDHIEVVLRSGVHAIVSLVTTGDTTTAPGVASTQTLVAVGRARLRRRHARGRIHRDGGVPS